MEVKEKADLLISLLQNEKFLARFNDVEDDLSKTKALFASEGLDLSDDQLEVVIDALRAARESMYTGKPMSESEMDDISGGGLIRSAAKRAMATAILAGTLYVGYKVYDGVKERGGIKNERVNEVIDTTKKAAKAAKEKADEAVSALVDFLAPKE